MLESEWEQLRRYFALADDEILVRLDERWERIHRRSPLL